MQMSGEESRSEIARVVNAAWDRLMEGETGEALALLRTVESECDSYSSFHVVLASAMLTLKEDDVALAAAKHALSLTPDSPHAQLIVEIAEERLKPAASDVEDPRPITPKQTLASLLDPLPAPFEEPPHFNIDKTADELTRERPLVKPMPEPEHIQPQLAGEETPALVSETLAEIMIRQGKLTEAKKVYIQLSRMQPLRYAHFKTKIEAIDKLLLGTSIAPETTDNDPAA
jgi:hypothetical protein